MRRMVRAWVWCSGCVAFYLLRQLRAIVYIKCKSNGKNLTGLPLHCRRQRMMVGSMHAILGRVIDPQLLLAFHKAISWDAGVGPLLWCCSVFVFPIFRIISAFDPILPASGVGCSSSATTMATIADFALSSRRS